MKTDQIICTRDGAVGHITFNNPERHNAMSYDMWVAGAAAIDSLLGDGETRVIVLSGAGEKAFVAGADISKFEKERGSADAVAEYNVAVAHFQSTLSRAALPTIAMIRGYAIGGGLAIALCCDIRIASEDSRFAIPAAKLGLGYAAAGIDKLMQVVGPSFAKEIFFTARQFDAAEARTMGLVNRIVPRADLQATVDDYTRRIAENAPLTIHAAKVAVGELAKPESERDLQRCADLVMQCFDSADFQEGRKAFMEKRKPDFKGV